jgi:hypothetical protein
MTGQREVKPWLDQHDRHVIDWINWWFSQPGPVDERMWRLIQEVLAFEEVRLH